MQNFNPSYARFVWEWKTQEIKIRDEHLGFYKKPLNRPSTIIRYNLKGPQLLCFFIIKLTSSSLYLRINSWILYISLGVMFILMIFDSDKYCSI